MFITIEDEAGVANLVVWEKVFETYRRAVLTGSMLKIDSRVQREGEVVHLIAYKLEDLSGHAGGSRRAGDDRPRLRP